MRFLIREAQLYGVSKFSNFNRDSHELWRRSQVSEPRDRTYVWILAEVRETVPGATVAAIRSGSPHAALDLHPPGSALEGGASDLRDSLRHERDPGSPPRKGLVGTTGTLRALQIADIPAPLGARQLLWMFGSGYDR